MLQTSTGFGERSVSSLRRAARRRAVHRPEMLPCPLFPRHLPPGRRPGAPVPAAAPLPALAVEVAFQMALLPQPGASSVVHLPWSVFICRAPWSREGLTVPPCAPPVIVPPPQSRPVRLMAGEGRPLRPRLGPGDRGGRCRSGTRSGCKSDAPAALSARGCGPGCRRAGRYSGWFNARCELTGRGWFSSFSPLNTMSSCLQESHARASEGKVLISEAWSKRTCLLTGSIAFGSNRKPEKSSEGACAKFPRVGLQLCSRSYG